MPHITNLSNLFIVFSSRFLGSRAAGLPAARGNPFADALPSYLDGLALAWVCCLLGPNFPSLDALCAALPAIAAATVRCQSTFGCPLPLSLFGAVVRGAAQPPLQIKPRGGCVPTHATFYPATGLFTVRWGRGGPVPPASSNRRVLL